MRSSRTVILCLLLVTVQIGHGHAQDSGAESARIVGRVLDQSGVILPGVTVALSLNGTIRQLVSDAEGRFAFDRVNPDVAYLVRATLAGFESDEIRDVTVAAAETRVLAFTLSVGCIKDALTVDVSDLFKLLHADTVAHVHVSEAVEDVVDDCGRSRQVVVRRALPISNAGRELGTTLRLLGGERLERGKDYLVVLGLCCGTKHPRIGVWFERDVVGGRVRGEPARDLGIYNGLPVNQALEHLRDVRARHRT